MTTLEGKVALITGGARGIGRGIAVALAEAGADIAIADVEEISSSAQQYGTEAVGGMTAAQTTLSEIEALGRRAISLQADVRRKGDTQQMVEATVRQLGPLDILVCNAGVINRGSRTNRPAGAAMRKGIHQKIVHHIFGKIRANSHSLPKYTSSSRV